MFTYYCIIIAVFLAGRSVDRYRFLAYTVAAVFLLEKLAYNHLALEIRAENKFLIYYIYAFIELIGMVFLYKFKSHFVISGLFFIHMMYNTLVPIGFFNPDYQYLYYAKNYIIDSLMIMELIYLVLLSVYVANHKRNNTEPDYLYIDSLFCVRGGLFNRGLS